MNQRLDAMEKAKQKVVGPGLHALGGDFADAHDSLSPTTTFLAREKMERAKGIEPSSLAWEARVMPLYDARTGC